MPTSIPQSVRQSWGHEAAEDFSRWFDDVLETRTVPRDEYREVLSRLDVLDHDMAGVKQEQIELRREMGEMRREMNARFDKINERFDTFNERFDERFDQMQARSDARFDQINERFDRLTRWAIGLLALFATMVTALLAIAQFVS